MGVAVVVAVRIKKLDRLTLSVIFGTIAALVSSPFVYGFSGTGAGTSGNPYKVASCEQLQAIADDLGAYYEQTGNIDCAASATWNSGAGFAPITGFTGSYDGNGYTINNLAIEHNDTNETGLFSTVSNATITAINLRGGHVINHNGTPDTASLIGLASNSTISSCSSTTTVEGGDGGGLIGTMVGGTLNKCWYNGTANLSGYRYSGGLSGLVMVGAVISNVYTAGSIQARGGLFGVLGTEVTLTDSYSVADVTYGDTAHAGGLFGSADGVINPTTASDVFFDGTISAPLSAAVGEIVGSLEAGATISNAYFQGSGTGVGVNSGGSGGGTGVNSGSPVVNYFKNNNSVAPLSGWDFASVWEANTGYPALRFASSPSDGDDDGYSDIEEASAPNAGDANGDGVQDSNQTNVTTFFNDTSNSFAVLQSSCDSHFNVQAGGESSDHKDVAFDYPAGLVRFVLHCGTVGATATVTLYFYGDYNPATAVLRKWNNDSSYTTISNATFSSLTIGGSKALKVQYQITDGSTLDQDGAADGNIVDPVGFANSVLGAPNTGFGGASGR